MSIVINGTTGITGVPAIGSDGANTPVIMNDSGSNSNTCRAWVNFNGTGTVAIRASFNVSSITDNGTGDYTVNFTNAFSDINYAPTFGIRSSIATATSQLEMDFTVAPTTTALRVNSVFVNTGNNRTFIDCPQVNISVFR